MRARILRSVPLAVALLLASTAFAAELKSGPQVGSDEIPKFNPLHCTGGGAGGMGCLV